MTSSPDCGADRLSSRGRVDELVIPGQKTTTRISWQNPADGGKRNPSAQCEFNSIQIPDSGEFPPGSERRSCRRCGKIIDRTTSSNIVH